MTTVARLVLAEPGGREPGDRRPARTRATRPVVRGGPCRPPERLIFTASARPLLTRVGAVRFQRAVPAPGPGSL
eukprot:2479051-Alexandrium_andersonii.AAC.1